jgi:hypothetical protein
VFRKFRYADNLGACSRYLVVIFNRAAANTNPTDEHAFLIDDRYAARKRNQSAVGVFGCVQWLTAIGISWPALSRIETRPRGDPKIGLEPFEGMAGRYTGSYLDRSNGGRAAPIRG